MTATTSGQPRSEVAGEMLAALNDAIASPDLVGGEATRAKLQALADVLTHGQVAFRAPRFPTMLRKMWTGAEVQAWIDREWHHPISEGG